MNQGIDYANIAWEDCKAIKIIFNRNIHKI